jgi:GGDEF domain-containing protein
LEHCCLSSSTLLATAITALEDPELQLIDQSNGLARKLLRLLSFRIRAANALLRRRQKRGEFYRQLPLNDALTGLYNRAWLTDMLPKLVARAQQDSSPMSLLMIDLDNFKKFNGMHGHVAGHAALAAAAAIIRGALRPSDFAVRYGGEEMLVVLPETSDWPRWWPIACAGACARPSYSTTCAGPCRTSRARSASPA